MRSVESRASFRSHAPLRSRSSARPRPRPEPPLFELIAVARQRQLDAGALPRASPRTGRAYFLLLVASLCVWVLLGYAIFLLVSIAG